MNVEVVWAGIVCFVALVYLLPHIFAAIGFAYLRYTAYEGELPPQEADPDSYDRDLVKLGFRSVGLIRECVYFHFGWMKSLDVIKYRSESGLVYASLYQLPCDREWRVNVAAYGPDGWIVSAAMPGVGWEYEAPNGRRIEVSPGGIAQLLAKHTEAVAAFTASGQADPIAVDLAEVAARELANDREHLRQSRTCSGLWLFVVGWGLPVLATALALSLVTSVSPLQIVIAAGTVGCLSCPLFTEWLVPKLFTPESCPAAEQAIGSEK